jgi:hypothetical protein
MTDAAKVDPLASAIMTLKFNVGDINNMINAMNEPYKTPVILWANIIAAIQAQCAPQIDELNKQAGTNTDGVPLEAEERN